MDPNQFVQNDSIKPGRSSASVVNTPLVATRLTKQLGVSSAEDLAAKRKALIPMGRMGNAWDIAHAVLFLSSDEASCITAAELVVDGGACGLN